MTTSNMPSARNAARLTHHRRIFSYLSFSNFFFWVKDSSAEKAEEGYVDLAQKNFNLQPIEICYVFDFHRETNRSKIFLDLLVTDGSEHGSNVFTE